MSTHNHHDNKPDDREPNSQERKQPDASAGFERSDVRGKGILIFMAAMLLFVVVTAMICYGVGKALFAHMAKEDGPKSKWAKTVAVRPLGNLPSSPELEEKMGELTQLYPTPRLQTDDGMQEMADLHAREDLLLENYSWANQAAGKVRIPIERAMELIAQSGLPVAPPAEDAPLLTGDSKPVVAVPLTNGFARTGFELDAAHAKAVAGERENARK
jgi:hypothetical protein